MQFLSFVLKIDYILAKEGYTFIRNCVLLSIFFVRGYDLFRATNDKIFLSI